ncbi:MAG: uncharacterized protein A8A55_3286, partial [Amphiamblys sp. WSBS2006]
MIVSSFDIAKMNLKNTTIEELFLTDEAAIEFLYSSAGRSEPCVEKFSFGGKSTPNSESFLNLFERVQGGESVAVRKIKRVIFGKSSFFDFLEEANRTGQKEIHLEELIVAQNGRESGPETGTSTSTKIVVSKSINIRGNPCVLRFIELGPEISHIDIASIQRQCRSPGIDIQRINIVLEENKIIIRGNQYGLRFLKKNITATDVG